MRRNNFWIGALVAVITFVTLSAFVHRPWGWHGHGRWGNDHCYYHEHNRHSGENEKNQDFNKTTVSDSTNY
jgi:hypothetical protein